MREEGQGPDTRLSNPWLSEERSTHPWASPPSVAKGLVNSGDKVESFCLCNALNALSFCFVCRSINLQRGPTLSLILS